MRHLYILLFFIPLFLFPLISYSQNTIYIAENATGSGSSWADASGDLQAALDSSLPGDGIWVKEGTYYPTTCTNCEFSDKNIWFNIPNGVKLFGSFSGNENSIDERNIADHPTYLSGDIDQDGTLENNSFTVIYAFHVSNLTEVNGFIITGGNAHDVNYPTGSPQNSGGAWFNNSSTNGFESSPVIRNCRFENNYAWGYGGAVFNEGSFTGNINATFENCFFGNNSSRSGGGAIYNTGSFDGFCSPQFINCFFENNECTDSDGGTIFNIGSENGTCNPLFNNCEFKNNFSGHDGGAVYSFGKNGNSSPEFLNCFFENNTADQGGAIYNDGTFNGFSGTEINNCLFKNNMTTLGDGGAIYNSGFLGTCNPIIINTDFENNTSTLAGGAIFNNGVEGTCNPTITNCRFFKNEAISFGGSIYNQGRLGNASPKITNCLFAKNKALSAGAIYNLGAEQGNANAFITNCTFYKNNANVGGAVYANAGEDTSGISSPTIVNCIFWENTANDIGDIFRIINGTPTISYSLVDKIDCNDLYHGNGGLLNCLDGMLFNEDPLFTDTSNNNFHLKNGSPVIDFGNNTAINDVGVNMDLDNLPRIYNGTVDFGVFEFGSTNSGAPIITQQPIGQELCEGENISLSVTASGEPPLNFQWFKNGELIIGAEENIFSINNISLQDKGFYHCVIANESDDVVISDSAFLDVQEPMPVSLTITASEQTICEGEEITLMAHPANGGSSPIFQWYINGNAFGGNIQSFNIDALNDGEMFTCEVISSASCVTNQTAISNTLTIHVENSVTAALSIVPDEEMPCEGQTVTFTASPENGGSSPSFQWSVNGIPTGDNTNIFQYIPQQNDEVYCNMISSKACVDMAKISSDTVVMEIIQNVTPTITITPSVDSTICIGDTVQFETSIEYGGLIGLEWMVNGQLIGGNESIYTTSTLNDGDIVSCELTSSLECVTENPVLSNEVQVSVDSCSVNAWEEIREKPMVLLYPNPTDGRIFVEMSNISANFTTRLLNTHGQILMSSYEDHPSGFLVKQEINLADLPQGIFYFQIITDDGTITTKRIVVY